MRAFENTPVTKQELMKVLEAHALADSFTKGVYWKGGKGCVVGCSLEHFTDEPSNHSEYERLFNVPRILSRLQDSIFEGLSNKDSKWWPVAFWEAVPEGGDLSLVWPRFAVWLLTDKEYGVIKHAKTEAQKKAIQDVADLYEKKVNGNEVSITDWKAVKKAAYDAAAAYAAYAAYAAADAARRKTRKAQADKLIELIKDSK